MAADLSPGTALFVGGFVAGLFGLAAVLTYVTAPDVAPVRGLAVALGALGAVFLAGGVAGAGLLRWATRHDDRRSQSRRH